MLSVPGLVMKAGKSSVFSSYAEEELAVFLEHEMSIPIVRSGSNRWDFTL